MGIRDLNWEARGISEERRREIYKQVTKSQNREILIGAAYTVNEYLAPYLVESLEKVNTDTCRAQKGYDTLLRERGMRCTNNDFYGYRKKTLIMADKILRLRSIL